MNNNRIKKPDLFLSLSHFALSDKETRDQFIKTLMQLSDRQSAIYDFDQFEVRIDQGVVNVRDTQEPEPESITSYFKRLTSRK